MNVLFIGIVQVSATFYKGFLLYLGRSLLVQVIDANNHLFVLVAVKTENTTKKEHWEGEED